nr:hypothetical protein GPGIFMOB_00365 [Acinetobacter gerneri]
MSTACSPWSTASCLSCPRSSRPEPSGSAKDRCGHSPARGLGGDLDGPDGDRRNIWHELQAHAGTGHAIWLLRRARSHSGVLPSPVHALQEGQVAMSNALRELLRPPSHSALCARACPIQFKMKVLP